MSGSFFHKPENALRRALELQNINQPDAALTLLHDVLSSRRHRTWSPVYEQVMILYLDLCLRRNRSREAKDGLHQYRNLSQSQAPGSLEIVIRHLLDKAEEKCRMAKEHADDVGQQESGIPGDNDDDADQEQDAIDDLTTHKSIMLSTMSLDPEKTQRETAVVLPSIKFLWEAYRAVLDILRSNSKLMHLYHYAASGALNFCRTYKRRTEFRRFCDMLRQHLGNLQKYGSNQDALDAKPNNKVRGWEGWTTESIEFHLQTRFQQLETASVLHLYTEGFKTVEDIYNILQISHVQARKNINSSLPKAKLMATYYEKLTDLFWVSENYLFHAFAWYKYYTLSCEYNKSMSNEQKQLMASTVLLAALCIPGTDQNTLGKQGNKKNITKKKDQISKTIEDDINNEKTARMATLLGFHTSHPTRMGLLQELSNKNILNDVPEYLRDLYILLEESTDPLVMVSQARPLLDRLKKETNVVIPTDSEGSEEKKSEDVDETEHHPLAQYVKPLTDVLLLKLLFNLSAAYHTVSLDHLQKLTNDLGLSFETVEQGIVSSTQNNKSFSVRIDHRTKCLRFGSSALESDEMRGQLTVLAKHLNQVSRMIEKPSSATIAAKNKQRIDLFFTIRANLQVEHQAVLQRKIEIEKRKEEVERLAQEKLREEMRVKAEKEAAAKQEEQRRLAREQKMREREKMVKIQKEMEQMEKKKYLKAMGKNTDDMAAEELETIDTVKLMKEHANAANKKKEEAERKLREQVRKLDYMVRAVRIEELSLVKARFEERLKKDKERYENETIVKAKRAKAQWELDVEEKAALQNFVLYDYQAAFEKMSMGRREILHASECKEAERIAEMEADERKLKRAQKRRDDEIRAKAEEAARLKEEEEKQKAEEEKARKEEERRKKAAEEEKRRQAEQAKNEELLRRDRDRPSAPTGPPSSRDLDAASRGGGKYQPPTRRSRVGDGGGYGDRGRYGSGGSGRYDDSRGGGYGGGRYNGARDRDSGGYGGARDRDGGGYGGARDRDGGGYGGARDRDSGGYGGARDRDGGGYGRDRDRDGARGAYGRDQDDRRGGDRPAPVRNSRWA